MFKLGQDANNIIDNVMDTVFKAVTSTMGPNGKLAVIAVGSATKTTKDGVTVAKCIQFDQDAEENINRVITEAAIKTDLECGDGTTTTIFLTKHLYTILKKYPNFTEHRQIEKLVIFMVEELTAIAIKPAMDSDDLFNLALTSANYDEAIADAIIKAYRASDKYPAIELKEGVESKDIIQPTDGMPLMMYYSNPMFSRMGTGETNVFEECYAIVIDGTVRWDHALNPAILGKVMQDIVGKTQNKPVLIVARGIDHEVNNMLAAINQQLGFKKFIPLNTNAGGAIGTSLLGDIATVLNTSLINHLTEAPNMDYNLVTETITVNSERSVVSNLSDDAKARIAARADDIELLLQQMPPQERYNTKARFNEKRVHMLRGELVTIYVGGETQSEVKERKDRFEDVNKAVQSALENGILPGIGYALRVVGEKMLETYREDEAVNKDILHDMFKLCHEQWKHLMYPVLNDELVNKFVHALVGENLEELRQTHVYGNLAMGGQASSPIELGVYDTAYASITALRGGFKTAKILATTDSILLGTKAGSVRIQ